MTTETLQVAAQLAGRPIVEQSTGPAVLYVDDEDDSGLVFKYNFHDRYRVATCTSGAQALARLAAGDVAVLIVDQRMPGMSGNQLLEQVRALYPDIAAIVTTAFTDFESTVELFNKELACRLVPKPWMKDAMIAAIEAAFEKWRHREGAGMLCAEAAEVIDRACAGTARLAQQWRGGEADDGKDVGHIPAATPAVTSAALAPASPSSMPSMAMATGRR